MFSFELIIFAISSAITLSLVYYQVPVRVLQQIITLLLVIILIFLNRFIFSRTKPTVNVFSRLFLLLLGSLIVQLVVLSTGGFFSPFLILLHLFTLGTSFLLNLKASISFLIFSLITLVANIYLSQNLMMLFREDPFSFALYLVSFIVIIPLAQLLTRSYHIKDTISKILTENLYQAQLKQDYILRGLNELVLVTDRNLKIVSVNQAVEKVIKLSSGEIVGKHLLEVLPLKNKDGSKVTAESLSVNQMITDKISRIIKNLYIDAGSKAAPIPVTIQERPITDSKGQVNQFVFVISEGHISGVYSAAHQDLDLAHKRHQAAFEDFEKNIPNSSVANLKLRAELLKNMEEDLLTAQEIEDHSIKESPAFPDVAEICQQAIILKRELAKNLNVKLDFVLPTEESITESTLLSLKEKKVVTSILPVSNFSIPYDPRWLRLLIEKLLDIAILLSSSQKDPIVQIILSQQNSKEVMLTFSLTCPPVSQNVQQELFTKYFGQLGAKTNLKLGSGLEGFILQNIVSHLKLPFRVRSDQYPRPGRLTFELEFSRERTVT